MLLQRAVEQLPGAVLHLACCFTDCPQPVWALWLAPEASEQPWSTRVLILGYSLSESFLGTGAGL